MNKEALTKLEKYLAHIKERLDSPVPPKHVHRPESLRFFLEKELAMTTKKIEDLKLGTGK